MNFISDMNTARNLGERAALARHQGDESAAHSHYDYITRLINTYTAQDHKNALWGAYNNGYKVESDSYDTPIMHSGNGTW
jgi:hypothetical protein